MYILSTLFCPVLYRKGKKNKKTVKNLLTEVKRGDILPTGSTRYDRITIKEVQKMTLQERMLDYRARERINQVEMAERCGLSKQTIYSIENGLQDPGKMTMIKIEQVIGKEADE